MRNPERSETPVIFLAMYWGGGGPYTIAEIISVYDWVNRTIPTRAEMESALNTLLAMGLIENQEETFRIPESRYRDFESFRKMKRKDRFETARMYFRQLPAPGRIPKKIRLTEKEYDAHYKAYQKSFWEAARRLEKKEQ